MRWIEDVAEKRKANSSWPDVAVDGRRKAEKVVV